VKGGGAAKSAFAAFLLCWTWLVAAQLPVPPISGRIADQTATLSAEQLASIEQRLAQFEAKSGSQLAVLIVPTTAPEPIEQYALRVAEQWKLGRQRVDDGALLLVAKDDRALRIEVGYGLEGALNDATSKRIISEIIVPRFREGDFYGGLVAGIDRIIGVIEGEALPPPARSAQRGGAEGGIGAYLPIIFVAALAIGGVLRAIFGRLMGSVLTGGAVGFLAWLFAGLLSVAVAAGVIALIFTLFGRTFGGGFRGGGLGGGFGGRGGFGGGGGFSGGGGGFGGGGASGRW
jgi:uncharacterized protein